MERVRCSRISTGSYPCDRWDCAMCGPVKLNRLRWRIADSCFCWKNVYFITFSPRPLPLTLELASEGWDYRSLNVENVWKKIKVLREELNPLRIWGFIERSKSNIYHAHCIVITLNDIDIRLSKDEKHTRLEKVLAKKLDSIIFGIKTQEESALRYVTKYVSKSPITNGRLRYYQYTAPNVKKAENIINDEFPPIKVGIEDVSYKRQSLCENVRQNIQVRKQLYYGQHNNG